MPSENLSVLVYLLAIYLFLGDERKSFHPLQMVEERFLPLPNEQLCFRSRLLRHCFSLFSFVQVGLFALITISTTSENFLACVAFWLCSIRRLASIGLLPLTNSFRCSACAKRASLRLISGKVPKPVSWLLPSMANL